MPSPKEYLLYGSVYMKVTNKKSSCTVKEFKTVIPWGRDRLSRSGNEENLRVLKHPVS